MYKIALVGFPNSGKTTLFNALTGEHARTGNWHGVTVEAASARLKGGEAELYDLPGIYGLVARSPEERASERFVGENADALFLCIIPAGDFARGYGTYTALAGKGLNVAVVLTFYDEFIRGGGKLDVGGLSRALGAPVIAVDGNKTADAARLKKFVLELLTSRAGKERSAAGSPIRTAEVAYADLEKYCTPPAYKEQAIDKILLNGFGCAACFFVVLLLAFFLTFGAYSPGVLLQELISRLMNSAKALIGRLLEGAGCGKPLIGFVKEGLIGGAGAALEFLPQITMLYAFVTILDETGLMARFAFTLDGVFQKIGLNGRAVFSVFMGFGCTAVAALSTRSLEDRALQKKAVLSLPFVSCSARLPIYLILINGFFPKYKTLILAAIYVAGLVLAAVIAALLDKFSREKQPFVMEMPPLRRVGMRKMLRSLAWYARQFLARVGGAIAAVIAALWLLKSFSFTLRYVGGDIEKSILAGFGKALSYLFYPLGVRDWRISVSVISGLFAKEAIIGTLSLLCPEGLTAVLTPPQALAFLAFCALYTPCFAALAAMKKEIGAKAAALSALGMFAAALIAGYVTYFLALAAGMIATALSIMLILAILWHLAVTGKHGCGNCRKCKDNNERNNCGKKRKTHKVASRKRLFLRSGAESAAQTGYKSRG